ncbi:hypothetical protein [Amnibacterium kyonggiense]
MAPQDRDPEPDRPLPPLDDDSAALRARFSERYAGAWPADDAFDWSRDPDGDSAAGSASPFRALAEERAQLYRPGVSDHQVRRYSERVAAARRELDVARSALLQAQEAERAGVVHREDPGDPRRRLRRPLLAAAATGVALAVLIAVLLGTAGIHRPAPAPASGAVLALRAVPLHLRGTPAQIAALRVAIRGDSEGPGALVTATAIRDVPALRSARALSESDVTATGVGSITIPDLDQFAQQRHATVLVFCERAAAYDWTMTASGAGERPRRLLTATGHGRGCDQLSYITVPLPPGVHAFTVTTRVAGRVRFLTMLQTAP